MARIAGVNLPKEKRVVIALTYIYGIGITKSEKILEKLNFDKNIKVKDITEEKINILREEVEKDKVEGTLRREVLSNIKRLKEINSFRGSRHLKSLPARGQRSKTNSRTVRGNKRKTIGSGRKPGAQKT